MKRIRIIAMIIVFSPVLNAQESINLEQCRKLALDHNQKMKIASEQVNATEDLKKAAFSQYLPNFSVNGAYTYINKDYQLLENDKFLPVIPYTAIDPATGQLSQAALSTPAVAASTFVINPLTGQPATDASGNPVFQKYTYLPADQFKLSLDNVFFINSGFTQPIYVGGKIKEANRIAQYTKELAEHNLSLTHDELIYSVDEAYWRIISLEEKVKLASDYKSMLKRLVSDIENIRAEGIITDNDLMKARLKLSETDLLLLKANNGLELSKMALCQMIGIPYSSNLTLSDSLDLSPDILQKFGISENSISERPELKMLQGNEKIAASGVKLMQSRYLPNIALNAGYTFMNPNPYNGFSENFGGDLNLGVVLNIPIFHFGDKKHTVNAARAEQNAASLKLEETKELLVLQLQQAIYRYDESAKKTQYASLALDQARQNLKYTEDNFHEGILKTTDLLEAQVLWQKAYSELIDSKTEQKLAESNLIKVSANY